MAHRTVARQLAAAMFGAGLVACSASSVVTSPDAAAGANADAAPPDSADATPDAPFVCQLVVLQIHQSAPCEWQIDTPMDFDLRRYFIFVEYVDAEENHIDILKDPANGWSFDDEATPSKFILHGTSCETATTPGLPGPLRVSLQCKALIDEDAF
jgi:hypothetical protein